MSRPLWFVALLKKAFPQRFKIARLSHLPGMGRLMDRMLFDGDHMVCLWKVAPDLHPDIGRKLTRMPGVELRVDPDLCLGCETCVDEVCFVSAIQMVNGQAQIGPECRGCGRCVEVCPNEAIELHTGKNDYAQIAIQALQARTDVLQGAR